MKNDQQFFNVFFAVHSSFFNTLPHPLLFTMKTIVDQVIFLVSFQFFLPVRIYYILPTIDSSSSVLWKKLDCFFGEYRRELFAVLNNFTLHNFFLPYSSLSPATLMICLSSHVVSFSARVIVCLSQKILITKKSWKSRSTKKKFVWHHVIPAVDLTFELSLVAACRWLIECSFGLSNIFRFFDNGKVFMLRKHRRRSRHKRRS